MSNSETEKLKPRKSILHVTGLLMVTRGASSALGMVREITIAAIFGASRIVDAFAVASVFHNQIFSTLSNVLASTLIPHYVSVKAEQGEFAAKQMVRAITMQLIAIMTLISLLGFIFAAQLVQWFAPTFTPAETELTIRFLRILIPSIIGASLFLVLQNVYQIHDQWVRPAIGPLIVNIISISVIAGGYLWIGSDVLAWSWLLSMVILPIILISGRVGRGYLGTHFFDRNTISLYRVSTPILIEGVFVMVTQIVVRYLGSSMPNGELSSMVYAQRVYAMSAELVVATFIPALLPRLAESSVHASREEYSLLLERALLGITLLAIGGAAILAGTSLSLVEVIFEHGAFTPVDSARVASLLSIFAGALLVYLPLYLVYRAYFVVKNSIVPALGMFLAVCLFVLISFLLIEPMGIRALAVATTASLILQFGFLVAVAKRYGVYLPGKKLYGLLLRGLMVGIVLAILLNRIDLLLRSMWEFQAIWLRLIKLFGLISLGIGLFALMSKLIRLPGYDLLMEYVKVMWQKIRKLNYTNSDLK